MRIAMYTDAFYPYPSGVSTAVLALANELAQEGHQIFIQAPRPKTAVDVSWLHPNIIVNYVSSVEIFIYPDFRIGTKNPISIAKVRQFAPEIVHVHTPLSIGMEGILTAKRLNLPLIQTFHTYHMDQESMKIFGIHNQRLANLLNNGGWRLTRTLNRVFDVTTAPSKYVEKDLKRNKVPGEIVYCPNILPTDYFAPHPRRKGDVRSFLFVGRLSPEKKVHVLLQSFAQVLRDHADKNLELQIVGDGPERENLVNLSFDLGIASAVRWHGKIAHDELIHEHLYHMSDVFVTASRFETFGYTTLEAMAHGLPVIAHSYRANTELIGDTGFLVPDTESETHAIELITKAMKKSLITDISDKRKSAFERAKKYTPEYALPFYITAYQKAIELRNSANPQDRELIHEEES